VSPTPPQTPDRAHHSDDTPRDRVRRALEDLNPRSPWCGVIATTLQALDEAGPSRHHALSWLHHAIIVRLPSDARRDSLEQRVLRRAAQAIEEENDADDGGTQRAA
jgi:hypothetical protein